MTLVIAQYAMAYHLGGENPSLTDAVKGWRNTWPNVMPLPHPSPRNNIWLKRNPWLAAQLLPALRQRVAGILAA